VCVPPDPAMDRAKCSLERGAARLLHSG
jgi:hypothetical protein